MNFDECQLGILEREYATIHNKIKELDGTTIISKPRPAIAAAAATLSSITGEAAEEKKKNTEFYRWAARDVVLRKVLENGKLDDSVDATATVSNIIANTTVHEIISGLSKHHGKALTRTNPTWEELEKAVRAATYGRSAVADTVKQFKQNKEGNELFGGGCIIDDGSGGNSSTKPVKLSPANTGQFSSLSS